MKLNLASSLLLLGAATVAKAQYDPNPEPEESDPTQIDQFFDIQTLAFSFGGVSINTGLAAINCPTTWNNLLGCLITKCPNFLDVCPSFGQDPATAFSCSAMKGSICVQTADEGCCLQSCQNEFLTLTTCFAQEVEDEELTNCKGPLDCEAVLVLEAEEYFGDGLPSNVTNTTTTVQEEEERVPLISYGSEGGEDFAGIEPFKFGPFGTDDIQSECPDEWQALVSCVVSDCPQFLDVCSGMQGPEDVTGSTAIAMNGASGATCDDLTHDICNLFSSEDCCMSDCMTQIQAATTCLHKAKSMLDLTTCAEVNCAIDVTEPEPPVVASRSGAEPPKNEESSSNVEAMDMNGDESILPAHMSGATSRDLLFMVMALAATVLA